MKNLFIVFSFFCFGLSGQNVFTPYDSLEPNAKVFAVHDGDSYKVLIDGLISKKWIRVYGVDCPEVISNRISKDQPYGRLIADSVRAMLKGKIVRIDSLSVDMFDRTVAKVYLNNVSMTDFLISKGWAWFWQDENMADDERIYLESLQNNARDKGYGFWGLPEPNVLPHVWRGRNKRRF